MRRLASLTAVLLVACSNDFSNGPKQTSQGAPLGRVAFLAGNRSGLQLRTVYLFYSVGGRGAATDRLQDAVQAGAEMVSELGDNRVLVVAAPVQKLASLRRIPWIDSAVVGLDNLRLTADTVPWGIDSTNADLVYASLYNGAAGVRVAFFDTGIDCDHHDLAARIAGGYDFFANSPSYCNGGSHGTNVAGIIGGSADGYGVVGMAPEVSLYAVRTCANDDCPEYAFINALQWAIENSMQVVNISFANCGGPVSSSVANKLTQALSAGIVIVAAAGNGTGQNGRLCPEGVTGVSGIARVNGVIGVTGVMENGSQPGYYQFGPEIDFAAPDGVRTDESGGATVVVSGTSFAAPHVSGLAALLIRQGFQGPSLVLQRLIETARPAGSPGKDDYFGYGLLDAANAVRPAPFITSLSGAPSPITEPGTYALTANLQYGIPPIQVRWDVTYNNGILPEIHTGYGSSILAIEAPPGEYSIVVTATPREQFYLRNGYGITLTLNVCTGTGSNKIGPDMVGGCSQPEN